jgi:hypothetical protein
VIKPQFGGGGDFVEGIAGVRTAEGDGYIDKKGNFIWRPSS